MIIHSTLICTKACWLKASSDVAECLLYLEADFHPPVSHLYDDFYKTLITIKTYTPMRLKQIVRTGRISVNGRFIYLSWGSISKHLCVDTLLHQHKSATNTTKWGGMFLVLQLYAVGLSVCLERSYTSLQESLSLGNKWRALSIALLCYLRFLFH